MTFHRGMSQYMAPLQGAAARHGSHWVIVVVGTANWRLQLQYNTIDDQHTDIAYYGMHTCKRCQPGLHTAVLACMRFSKPNPPSMLSLLWHHVNVSQLRAVRRHVHSDISAHLIALECPVVSAEADFLSNSVRIVMQKPALAEAACRCFGAQPRPRRPSEFVGIRRARP